MTPLAESEGSFEEFMAGSLAGLLRFGYVLTGDRHRADDLVQAALVATYRRWRHVRADGPHAYVRRAMVNTHTSMWRRTRRETLMPEGFDSVSGSGNPSAYDEADELVRVMRVLPARQRAVIVLRYYDDLTEAETARVLGCSVGTVKSHASRALRSLRTELETRHAIEEKTLSRTDIDPEFEASVQELLHELRADPGSRSGRPESPASSSQRASSDASARRWPSPGWPPL